MFWHNNYVPSVQIDSLLNEEDVTLSKIMDAEDILQECKSQNKKLIDFLTRPDILEELVNLITEEPSKDLDELYRYKYSNIACELLTCDVPILTEKLAANEMLLSKLYSFIDKKEPLNPLLASFFNKTLHALLRRASDQNWFSHQFVCLQVIESLKSRKNCIDLLLQHIETSAIMDLILILLTKIEGDEMRQNIQTWLDDQQLVQRVVQLLSPSLDSEKHTNASQLLCDIIKSPRMEPDKRPDPILQTLQSEETIKLILDTILTGEKVESSIVGGIRVLINLLGQKENKTTESSEICGAPFSNVVENELRDKFALIIIPYLDKLNQLLINPPEKPSVKTTAGFLEKPFGRTRLYMLKLLVSLISTNNISVFEKFAELNTFNILLDLFFQFAWNNFLHTQVQQCLSLAINCDCPEKSKIVFSHIFVGSKLIERILEAWEYNDNNSLNQQNSIRQGYMGHVIIIANEIVTRCTEINELSDFLKTNLPEETSEKWKSFISTKLDEINRKQQLILGEPPEGYTMSSSGNSNEYASFSQDAYGQELFSNYQEQSSGPSIYADEEYKFRMKKFNDGDDTFHNSVDNLSQTFDSMDDDYEKRQEIFNKLCDEKKFDYAKGDESWEHSDDFPMQKSDWLSKKKHNSSSSSDEDDEDDIGDQIEADVTDPWNSMHPLSNFAAQGATTINLWNTEAPKPVEQTGWANFESAFSTDNPFQEEPRSDAKAELPKVPINNENTSLPESEPGGDISNSENVQFNSEKENVNMINDSESKTEEINVSSISHSECIESSVNIPDSNANLTVIEKKSSESKDISKNLEDISSNISEASSENLTNVQTVTSATDNTNVSPIATSIPEPSK
ncbi:serine/threonine-protein phosphatase 6 regulatory subunit 3 [Phymastichus coffea]|uniref:serine/threonine-protein phosphatase 6 regulatory subunit 3 n=1 Tax=Phymastichus coffea TaxID=108790 RepID=UPI00273BAE2A|nr:serine/threonine-protein phosphatase 6 regulatory subunit 3 [Phymastichus coffea]XP_058792585.1 serine/threonine-protein phosphatase 6 regulatory subunit 3 [Phymastichus coffea]